MKNKKDIKTFSMRFKTEDCNILDCISKEEGFKTRSGYIYKILNEEIKKYKKRMER